MYADGGFFQTDAFMHIVPYLGAGDLRALRATSRPLRSRIDGMVNKIAEQRRASILVCDQHDNSDKVEQAPDIFLYTAREISRVDKSVLAFPSAWAGIRALVLEHGTPSKPAAAFEHFTALTSLTLHLCPRMSSLPVSLVKLTALRKLVLDEIPLPEFPGAVHTLSRLEELHLKNLKDVRISPESFTGLVSLRTLKLDNIFPATWPDPFGDLTNLRKLCIAGRTTLGRSSITMRTLLRLETLTIKNALQINEYPPLGYLTGLRKLKLCACDLSMFPRSLLGLPALEFLSLDTNRLIELPDDISRIVTLRTLKLSHNLLVTLPKTICNLISLQHLYVDNNCLQSLPRHIGHRIHLESLYIERNFLTVLPLSLRKRITPIFIDDRNLSRQGRVRISQTRNLAATFRYHLPNVTSLWKIAPVLAVGLFLIGLLICFYVILYKNSGNHFTRRAR